MGANAQTSVPLFASGEVLTAVNQNLSAGTGVPVFATTATRDAAFGGAGEKVLAEGQLAYIEALNVVQYYDGAVWATVGPASASGLVFLTGATFTSQTTVAFPNSTFTSTYDYYLVQLDTSASAGTPTVSLQVRDNGGTKTAANYYGGSGRVSFAGTETLTGTNGQTSFALATNQTVNVYAVAITVANPASSTKYTKWHGTGIVANTAGFYFGGEYDAAEAHTGLVFTFSGASSGLYNVYGLANS